MFAPSFPKKYTDFFAIHVWELANSAVGGIFKFEHVFAPLAALCNACPFLEIRGGGG